jgi:hypothetical protein
MNFVSLQFRYSKEEYVAAVREYYHSFHSKMSALICLGLITIGLAALFLSEDAYISSFLISVGVFGLLIFCLNYFIGPQRVYDRNPKLWEEYALEFSDAGVLFKSKDIDSVLQWSLYHGVRETDRFYYLIYGKDSFTLVPKRVFTSREQEYAFRSLVKEHVDRTFEAEELKAGHSPEGYRPRSLEPPDWR